MSDDMLTRLRDNEARLRQTETKETPGDPGFSQFYTTGTFTPVLAGSTGGGTYTYTVQYGAYTRIGNRCLFNIHITITVITVAPTGVMEITGLPFTSAAGAGNPGGAAITLWQGFTFPAGYTQLMGAIGTSSTVLLFIRGGSNVAAANVAAGELALVGGAASWQMFGVYQV